MLLWRPQKAFFLDEVLQHEGLGDDVDAAHCVHCRVGRENAAGPVRLFKCEDCGQFLQCEACLLSQHERTPLHVIQEWTGNFWVPATLRELGLVYQLGHGGFPCVWPDDKIHTMVVIEVPVIHRIHLRYCKCSKSDTADNLEQLMRNRWYPATVTDPRTCSTFRSLEAYRLYNVVGNLNVRDFITSLERVTNSTASTGMTWLPDRYKQFQRMARQWSFLMRLKRAGHGHDPAGADATQQGDTAVTCWACPYDRRNLPPNWRNVDPKYQFLYMLLLAMDANFRLKNWMRTNEIDDPSLGPGWGYWVDPVKYKRHLRQYVSTCIAFAVLLQKDTRLTTGLPVSGVGGCVCARHECMRANGLGDLQKGERYSNMDFIVMSALARRFNLMLLTISYDIACQWQINLHERNAKMPKELRLPLDEITLQCALPVWHASSHNEDCKNANSLSFKRGVGKSDGEGVERTWAVLNPAAFHTKDVGSRQRADVLEGKIDNHNHLKNIGQGDALQWKLIVTIAERDKQIKGFEDVNRTVKREVLKEWKDLIQAWEEDPSKPNPYVLTRKDCPSEAEVRLQVRKDEDALTARGKAPLHGNSAMLFLTAGIQIEDAQRRIIAELAGTVLLAADRENRIQEWCHTLLSKITRFWSLQMTYMPGAAKAIEAAEAARDIDTAPPKPEKVKLYMPSQMEADDADDDLRGCVRGLLKMEAKLRVAQCDSSLMSLRSRLHAKGHLIFYRNSNVSGQVAASRAQTLIGELGEWVEAYAARYWRGRVALLGLEGPHAHPDFQELRPEDVQLDGDAGESDEASWRKLGMIQAGKGAWAPSTLKKVMSGIWTAPGMLEDREARIHECEWPVCVEWARARARKIRWVEEVMLLREEMCRILRYLAWQTAWWEGQVSQRQASEELASGLRGYALKQAQWHEQLAGFFQTKWNTPAETAGQRWAAIEAAGAELETFFSEE
ncbi:hypothetical protein C8R44DRAFT_604986 [Mycena epipterygia]|nr:hypothetical protein C8R44DRAFT_604986 [Mycena epipterygia]